MEELSKADKKVLESIIKKGNLARCHEWLGEMKELLDKPLNPSKENEFDRCMEITRKSRDFYKEAMWREDCYRNSMLESGVSGLLKEGYVNFSDLAGLSDELQAQFARIVRMKLD